MRYLDILVDEVHPTIWHFYPDGNRYFMDDIATIHRTRNVQNWFAEHQHLPWPPHSPDPNPIENGELSLLEQRLENLEKELQRNREMLAQVKDTVRNVIKVEPNPHSMLMGPVLHKANRSYVNLSVFDCQLCLESSVISDENTLDMYENIEFENKDGGVWKQGWNIEYDPLQWNEQKKLKIFVVPHSHNDPGWIKTFEKYFKDQTQHILNNMVLKMKDDKKKKFIWAEVSFFALWWEKIDANTQLAVKKLLSDGQLEIVTGGWVMNDEATAHYFAMIEQMIEGHQWLEQNLDYKPKNGWAIDPFGLSPTMAYLLRRMGLDNMVIQRVHYSVKKYLAMNKGLEFLWRQPWAFLVNRYKHQNGWVVSPYGLSLTLTYLLRRVSLDNMVGDTHSQHWIHSSVGGSQYSSSQAGHVITPSFEVDATGLFGLAFVDLDFIEAYRNLV
ncbi:alpha-mannosidase 2 [Trichonephila clavipes]|nr:alpha-mannosidase 2 [Trichonephila clavipes]